MTDRDKKEYIILIFLIVILTIVWIYTKFHYTRMNYSLPRVPAIDQTSIDKIVIINKKVPIVLHKENQNWLIGKECYIADIQKISNMLQDMHNLELTTLVSENKDYARYWLDKEDGIIVSMFIGNKKQIEVVIGKLGPNYSSTYVRIEGNPNIYLARGNLRLSFDVDVDEIRDKKILSFKDVNINKLLINYRAKVILFDKEKEKKKWSTEITPLLNQLNNLECITYNVDPSRIKNKKSFVYIKLEGKKDHELTIFKVQSKDMGDYIGKSSDRKGFFKISTYSVNNLIQRIKRL